jgi:CheY-like chemotaxis protein
MAVALGGCGASIAIAGDVRDAEALLEVRTFGTVILHHALGEGLAGLAARARMRGMRVIGVITPAERRRAGADLGGMFDNYLIKPVRTRSLLGVASGEVAPDVPVERGPATLRALLAEDDPISALLARAHLERLGYRTVQVGDGAAAISAFGRALDRDEPFDLVLTDLNLPALDGFAVARHIRAIEADRGGHVAILGTSAHGDDARRQEAQDCGMAALIAKPLDSAGIAAALRNAQARGKSRGSAA